MKQSVSKTEYEEAKITMKVKFNGKSYEILGTKQPVSYEFMVEMIVDFDRKVMIFDEHNKLFAVLVAITAEDYKTDVQTQK